MITQAIREEVKTKHGHMSDAAVEKFRAMKEQDKADAIAGERFKNALSAIVPSKENLLALLTGYNSTPALNRNVHKLLWWIDAGYLLGREIDSICMIGLFSRLSGDEFKMTDRQFLN